MGVKTLGPTLSMIFGASLIGYSVGLLIRPLVCPVIPPPPNDYGDWAGPHLMIDWPQFIASIIVPLVAGVGLLIVWFFWRKREGFKLHHSQPPR
jgi:hypothetical protein